MVDPSPDNNKPEYNKIDLSLPVPWFLSKDFGAHLGYFFLKYCALVWIIYCE